MAINRKSDLITTTSFGQIAFEVIVEYLDTQQLFLKDIQENFLHQFKMEYMKNSGDKTNHAPEVCFSKDNMRSKHCRCLTPLQFLSQVTWEYICICIGQTSPPIFK